MTSGSVLVAIPKGSHVKSVKNLLVTRNKVSQDDDNWFR